MICECTTVLCFGGGNAFFKGQLSFGFYQFRLVKLIFEKIQLK